MYQCQLTHKVDCTKKVFNVHSKTVTSVFQMRSETEIKVKQKN